MRTAILAAAVVLGSTQGALADGAKAARGGEVRIEASAPRQIGFGARVGGYGFRRLHDDGSTLWTDCRMDGIGLFGTMGVGRVLFAELGLDFYHANTEVVRDEGMDRISTQLSGAIGARMFPKAIVSPYIQLGVGAELTQVAMGDGPQDTRVFPLGFVGVGGDLKIGKHLRLGAQFRMHMMAHFEHGHSDYVDVAGAHVHDAGDMPSEYEPAAQAQFFLRYDL